MTDRIPRVALLVLSACYTSAPPPAQPQPTAEASAPVTIKQVERPTLALECDGPDITLHLTEATLTLASDEPHRSKQRWNEVRAEYRLEAKGLRRTGRLAGARDADFVYMHVSDAERLGLIVTQRDSEEATIKWSTDDATHTQDSGGVSCRGSLLTAAPDAR
jgi:hypothetical protein